MTTQNPTIAVYGPTGHTGGYILTDLHRRGLTPILVGRSESRLRQAAHAAGLTDPDIRVATLDDHPALVTAFTGADVVISSLSAYVDNGAPVVRAAIEAGAHYTDLSGEQVFLRQVLGESPAAEAAGVTLVPGATDNNVPADLLAHLVARRLDGPADLVISHHSKSGGNGSKGSAKTVFASLDWFRTGGWHYADGALRTDSSDRTELTLPGAESPIPVRKFPQPPVVTVPRHTDVASVTGVLSSAILATLGSFTEELIAQLPDTPDADLRYDVIVDAHGPDRTVRGVFSGLDSYRDTALLAVEIAVRLARGGAKPGALAPAELVDPAAFLDSLATYGLSWRIEDPR